MKQNRSLAISNMIQECKMGNIIGQLESEFPELDYEETAKPSSRKRIYTPRNTLLTMVLTAIQQDKTLQNSVDMYYVVHQEHKVQSIKSLEEQLEKERILDQQSTKKKPGRPKKYELRLSRSMDKDISLNTAAYSKARKRLPVELTESLFRESRIKDVRNSYSHWHGYRVFIGDGTYVQMQDTKSLKAEYGAMHEHDGYPQGLLEVVIERGTGQIYSYRLSNTHVSELSLFYDMIDELPTQSILLLDDLYNCFEIISKCKRKGIEFVMPAKREKSYQTVEVLGPGDQIICRKTPRERSKWLNENEAPNTFLLRRIECLSPEGKIYVLYTTILDRNIGKDEIQMLYLTRWDIEISILEAKSIMDINVLRSQTPEMVLKELAVSLATYNLLRKIIYASIKDLPFSPKEDIIQKMYSLNKDILIDKKGRVYNQWSTGRGRAETIDTEADPAKAEA